MVLRLFGRSTNFQVPISTRPWNSSVDATSHSSFSGEDIASRLELGTSWNICMSILLMLPVEGSACGCCRSHSFVGWNEYQGACGCNGVISSKGALKPHGALGGVRGLVLWGLGVDVVWPGVGGVLGDWARLARSRPDESDSLWDSGVGGRSMAPMLTVSTLILSQGIKFLQISHHEKC